ncbi:DUF4148 domain-containing protein [Paraburkholderia phymatum]|uniref:DUF4148 domain-containing protein n=1 Tax=Paraburkholderia phymatum TaxID=148447 RepID=UPI00317CDA0D
MKRVLIPAVVIASLIASSTVFAETATDGKTRAQVRAELAEARQAGVLDAPDATYPTAQLRAAAALQAPNAAAANVRASAVGGAVTGHTQSGRHTVAAPQAWERVYFGQ